MSRSTTSRRATRSPGGQQARVPSWALVAAAGAFVVAVVLAAGGPFG